jgi:hypothetical protein
LIDEDIVGDWRFREGDWVVWQGKIEWVLVQLAILSYVLEATPTFAHIPLSTGGGYPVVVGIVSSG